MTDDEIVEVVDELFKEGRSAFIALAAVSAFSIVTLLGTPDTEFFALARQIELPIIGAEMSIGTFFWVAPLAIALLNAYLHLLIARISNVVEDAGDLGRHHVSVKSPIFVRWAVERTLTQRGAPRADGLSSLLSVYGFSVSALSLIWWRSHVLHDLQVTAFASACLASIILSHVLVVHRIARSIPQAGGGTAATLAAIALLFLVAVGSLFRVSMEGNPLYARADLSSAEISPRPDGYVPRFVWVSSFLRRHSASDGRTPPLDGAIRHEVDEEWFQTRQSYLKEFAGSDLDGVDFTRAHMSKSFLVGVRINQGRFDEAIMFGADMEGIDATLSSFRSANLEGAHLEQAYLKKADFTGAQMDRAHLEESTLPCTRFVKADLTGARLDGAFMDRATFRGARLVDASLRGAYAKRVDFRGADLAQADLRGAILWGADLSQAKGLTQEQLDRALGDDETKLPSGLSIPTCWKSVPPQEFPYRQQWWLAVGNVQERIACPWNGSIPLSPSTDCR